jgi:hypothetical protein
VRVGGIRFDWVFSVGCLLSVVGLYIDGYAHATGLVIKETTFWTPYHFVMYGAFAAMVVLLAGCFMDNWWAAGHPLPSRFRPRQLVDDIRSALRRWLPIGYDVTVVGAAMYFIAGGVDMWWHSSFGIEANVEALFSPSHLGLLVGAALLRTGPLRSAWLRDGDHGLGLVPAIASATFLLASLMFFTMYVGPFGITASSVSYGSLGLITSDVGDMSQILDWVLVVGIAGIFLHTALLMGMVLLLVDRWGRRLPFGTFTVMFTVTAAALGLIRASFLATGPLPLIGVAFVSGLVADVLLQLMDPSARNVWRFRLFAVVVPVVMFALYFGSLAYFSKGVWWSMPLWTGMILLPGTLGYVMSFLVLQPPFSAPKPLPAAAASSAS